MSDFWRDIGNWQKDTYGQKPDYNDPNWDTRPGNNPLQDAQERDYIDQRKKAEEAAEKARKDQGGGKISIDPSIFGLRLTLPKIECRPGSVPLPNPRPPVPGTNTDPSTNSSSTNGGTNRPINWGTNPSNITIREAPSNVNTNPTSTNRITNGPRISYPILR